MSETVAVSQISHRDALELISATVDVNGRPVGHWHNVALKIARAALFGHMPELSPTDWSAVGRNLPAGHRLRAPLSEKLNGK